MCVIQYALGTFFLTDRGKPDLLNFTYSWEYAHGNDVPLCKKGGQVHVNM